MFFLSNTCAWAICLLFAYVYLGTTVTVALTVALLSYFIHMKRHALELQQFEKNEESTGKVIDYYVNESVKLQTEKTKCKMKITNCKFEIRELTTKIRSLETSQETDSKSISELQIRLKRKQIEVQYLTRVKTALSKRLSNQKEVIEVLQTTRTTNGDRTDVRTQHKLEELKTRDVALQQKIDVVVIKLETLHNTPDDHIEALDTELEAPEVGDDSERDDNTLNEAHVDAGLQTLAVANYLTGQPKAEYVSNHTITLSWTRPIAYQQCEYYQVSYRNQTDESAWKVYREEFTNNTGALRDLASCTEYQFRVRGVYMNTEALRGLTSENEYLFRVNWGTEGPYSEVSEVVKTPRSRLSRFEQFLVPIGGRTNSSPTLYALPTKEIQNARNENYKIRKLKVGRSTNNATEKTILLVGETGTGKSTLIKAMINYILRVRWDDSFRFSFVHNDECHTDQEHSETEWITCYAVNHDVDNTIPYTINIIDTPGFGDRRGIDRDLEIAERIRELFNEPSSTGISTIDAVCIVVGAPYARLDPSQKYIFQTIISLLGKDIRPNICTLITFADGCDPPVLNALRESQLPFGENFAFNNASLYAEKNDNFQNSSLSPIFWKFNTSSFRTFFDHLATLEQKGTKLTSEVLNKQKQVETTLVFLQMKLDAGNLSLDKFRSARAAGKTVSPELSEMKGIIQDTKHAVEQCQERLKEISLCPSPLNNIDLIENIMDYERMNKRPGWLERLDMLLRVKRTALVLDNAKHFLTQASKEIKERNWVRF